MIDAKSFMAINPPALGHPGLITMINGVASCTLLPRAAMQGDATRYREDLLQQLIANTPSLLPVKDFLPATTALFSLGREIALDLGGHAGYIDNLLVTNEGRLVLVETKLWRNPDSTREVIAQILQYGMALSALSLHELEAKLKFPAQQSISDFVASHPDTGQMIENFEDALERHLRRGEMLYLIASDGIRFSVERITHWLNEGGSAPFKFGLVELQFFEPGTGDLLVIPRTLLKTREVSRHVVVVDVQGPAASSAVALVYDDLKSPLGSHALMQRSVKTVGLPMTRERLIDEVRLIKGSSDAQTVESIIRHLDAMNLDTRSTSTLFQYGIMSPADEGIFLPLISLGTTGAFSRVPQKLIDLIGNGEFVRHKLAMNHVANFYRPEQALDPKKTSNELIVGYGCLIGKESALVQSLTATLTITRDALSNSDRP